MRKLGYLLIFVMLIGVWGCEPKTAPVAPKGALVVENHQNAVRLNHTTDTATITFTSTQKWHVTTSGDTFTVTPTRGEGSTEKQTLTITMHEGNNGIAEILRGSLNICLDGYSTKYKVDVVQCPKPERTIVTWFFGTSLSYYFGINVDCMLKALSSDILGTDRFIVFVQTSRKEAVIKELYYDKKRKVSCENIIRKINLPESYNAENFGQLLADVLDIVPSDSYAMIVGGHSTAWLPSQPVTDGAIPLSVGGYLPNWSPAIGAEVTRNIGENNVKLDIADFSKGLTATGQIFDWIYFDVCFMSSLEAAFELRNNAHYLVGSPCEIMGYGSPFDLLLDELIADDLKGACSTYYNYYAFEYYGSKSGCTATIVCGELDKLAAKMKTLNASGRNSSLDLLNIQYYEGRGAHIFYDVEDYVMQSYADETLMSDFCVQLDKAVINRFHTSRFYSAYNAQMNDIRHYSGINCTPDDQCVPILEAQINDLSIIVAERKAVLNELKQRLENQGISPSSSEEYTTLNRKVNELIAKIEKLQEQIKEFNHYHPSHKLTAWYKATH